MSELNYPESNNGWAQRRGIAKRCAHGWHDPNIACPKCKKEEERQEKETKEREEKKRRLKEAFDNMNKWLDNTRKEVEDGNQRQKECEEAQAAEG